MKMGSFSTLNASFDNSDQVLESRVVNTEMPNDPHAD